MASQTKLTRDNTMEAATKEGIEFLEKELTEKVTAVAKEEVENSAGDAPAVTKNGDSPPNMPKENTMVTTAEQCEEFQEKQGGIYEEAKTRSQETETNNAEKENDEKSATKRSAEDEAEQEVEEAKKAKTEDVKIESNEKEETTPQEANPAE